MGLPVGAVVGRTVGPLVVGAALGLPVGAVVGTAVGAVVVGPAVGLSDGVVVGIAVGGAVVGVAVVGAAVDGGGGVQELITSAQQSPNRTQSLLHQQFPMNENDPQAPTHAPWTCRASRSPSLCCGRVGESPAPCPAPPKGPRGKVCVVERSAGVATPACVGKGRAAPPKGVVAHAVGSRRMGQFGTVVLPGWEDPAPTTVWIKIG